MQRAPEDVQRAIWKAAVVGGLCAGTIDITYAIVANAPKGVTPTVVFQSVASGLLGRAAYHGGVATAVAGLLLHLAMVVVMALIFISAARNSSIIRKYLLVSALLYGALLYFGMRWVIVPLSRFPGDLRVFHPLELLTHMVGVGLVIALVARWFGALDQSDSTPWAPASASGENSLN